MKKSLNKLINLLEIRTDQSLFEINSGEIKKANLMFLRQIAFTAALVSLILTAVSFAVPSISELSMPLFILCVISSIAFGVTCIAFDILLDYSFTLMYLYTAVVMAFLGAFDVYFNQDGLSVMFSTALALLPICILDKQSHTIPYTIVIWIAFCGASLACKSINYAFYDIFYATISTFAGITVSLKILRSRVSNLNSSRILARQVDIDELTGLPNYKKLMEDLSGEKDSRVAKSLCSLAFIEIDKFKEYNEKYGRESGDKCLKKIGNCMLRICDPNEIIIYRYGGINLVVVSLIHDYKGMQRVCQGISSLIRGLDIEYRDAPTGKITVSCGFTDVVECECDEYKKLLDMAQQSAEQAKKEGGNTSIGYLQLKAMNLAK